jgi:hypothetical protein
LVSIQQKDAPERSKRLSLVDYRMVRFPEMVMHGMKRSILVATPSWGIVYIASRSDTTVLELFWNRSRAPSFNERKAAVAWLSAEGWLAYASGAIGDADQEILKLIAEA